MNVIYRLFGYNTKRINAAVLIQKRFKEFRKRQKEEREKLIESIHNTFNNNYYTVITGFVNDKPILYKETIRETNINNDEEKCDIIYHLQERRRIKNREIKSSTLYE